MTYSKLLERDKNMINQLIGLLLPSIIGLKAYDKINGEEKTLE